MVAAAGIAAAAFADKFTGVVDKPHAAEFGLTTAVFGAVALLAPLLYQACQFGGLQDEPSGTMLGLYAATAATLTGAFGALAAIVGLLMSPPCRRAR